MSWLRDAPRGSNHHPDIILAGLALTGLVVAQQVRRIRALTEAGEPPQASSRRVRSPDVAAPAESGITVKAALSRPPLPGPSRGEGGRTGCPRGRR